MEVTCPEVARLIELNKRKAELDFTNTILGKDTSKELNSVISSADDLSAKIRRAGIEILIPSKGELDTLAKKMEEFPKDTIKEAFTKKHGPAYELLRERGVLVRRNYENRFEIAKLSLLAFRMPTHERAMLAEAVYFGKIDKPLPFASLPSDSLQSLALFLSRCGLFCTVAENSLVPAESHDPQERQFRFQNRVLWLKEGSMSRLDSNEKKIKELMPVIQLKNAERQIKTFSETEETEFDSIQHKYLSLLKEQDEILNESYAEESKLSVTVSV